MSEVFVNVIAKRKNQKGCKLLQVDTFYKLVKHLSIRLLNHIKSRFTESKLNLNFLFKYYRVKSNTKRGVQNVPRVGAKKLNHLNKNKSKPPLLNEST